MSKYTTEVRYICENAYGLSESKGESSVNKIIAGSWEKIFDNTWEIFDEAYRSKLCCKILKHYYLREICSETVGIWRMWLNQRMNEIMPYYNQLYKSAQISFEPFKDIDYTRNYTKDTTGTITDDGTNKRTDNLNSLRTDNLVENNNGTDTNRYSDTPQGGLDGIENNTYLTNASIDDTENTRKNTGTQTVANTGTQNYDIDNKKTTDMNDSYTENVKGKSNSGKSYAEMLMEYRKTFLNIDMQIIDELKDLFFNLW